MFKIKLLSGETLSVSTSQDYVYVEIGGHNYVLTAEDAYQLSTVMEYYGLCASLNAERD